MVYFRGRDKINTGMTTVEITVMCAIVVLVLIGMYGLLKQMNVLDNIVIWFRNCFARGTVNI